MAFLTESIEDTVYYSGRLYRINMSFDVVIEVQSLLRESELSDNAKLEQAMKMLVRNHTKVLKLSFDEQQKLLQKIFDECIDTAHRSEVRRQELPVVDFEYDGEYIYASFMLDYGIDLLEMQGRLPWKKFIALFRGLSEQSKMREVIRIRTMEIPRFTGKNGKQIQEIQELKSYYALPVRGGGGQKGLESLFSTLERMAVKRD